jgi:hypothetical protein
MAVTAAVNLDFVIERAELRSALSNFATWKVVESIEWTGDKTVANNRA